MNPDQLDNLLRDYAKRSLPPTPAGLTPGVWREIEQRRRRGPWWSRVVPVLSWREVFAEPRLAIASVALALLTGVLPIAAARSAETPRLARNSLHLDVFSTRSPGLPATLLADASTR